MGNRLFSGSLFALVVMLGVRIATRAQTAKQPPHDESIAVGAQYDSTHVYVAPGDLDPFVKSFVATFGGQASKPAVMNVLPEPSSTQFQYIWTAVGTLSVFAF
jgi:hypothetical protein